MGRVQLFLLLLLYYQVRFLNARSRDRFVSDILSEYNRLDQAGQADTNKDGVITDTEFANNLYKVADIQGNHDDEVTRDELIDYYSLRYNFSSELSTIMFDYLNDQRHPDDVINTRDVTLMSFSGKSYISIHEYRKVLEKWISQSAGKLLSILNSPSLLAPGNSREINYDYFINTVDANKDKIISLAELVQEIKRMSTSGSVRRGDWVKRTTRTYDAHPAASQLVFDFWDKDGDLTLTTYDLQSVLRQSDFNDDRSVGTDEFVRFLERAFKLSQRVIGVPLSTSLIQCPDIWWRDMGGSADLDTTRAIMDLDDDLNGWISVDDLNRWLETFDDNDDSFISRSEYTGFQWQRYKINATTAAAMFILSDINGDDKLDQDDWFNYFKGNLAVSFCDARHSLQYLITVAQESHRFAKTDLREATKKRIEEEMQGFPQNRPAQPPTRPREICSGQVACYVGEVTEEWWRPEAWLWWGVYLPEPPSRPSLSMGGGVNPFAQMFPPLGGVLPGGILGVLPGGIQGALQGGVPGGVTDNRGFSGSNWPQWPSHEFNSMPHMGSWSPYFPFKRSTIDPFRSKESPESITNSPKVTQFRHQVNPFRHQAAPHTESDTAPGLDQPEKGLYANPSIQASNMNSKKEGQDARNTWFQPVNDNDFSKQLQNNKSQSSSSENADRNLDTEWPEWKGQNKSPGPLRANSYPFKPIFGRLERNIDEQELKRSKRGTEEKNNGARLEENGSEDNETIPWASIRSWRPSFMMHPPMFSIPPWDPLLAWMAERELWNAFLAQEWGDIHEDNSSVSNSSSQLGELWEKLSEMLENSKERKNENEKFQESGEKNSVNQDPQDLNKSRGKRYMGSNFAWQTLRPERFQLLPLFPFNRPYTQDWSSQMSLLSRFWPQYGSQNWAVNKAFLPTNRWTNDYRDLNFNPSYYQNFRTKRKAGDGRSTKGNSSQGERRDSPFNQWKTSMPENDREVNFGKSDNIWRSEERKYPTLSGENMKDWTKQGKFDDHREGILQKLLQSSTVKNDFSRNYKQSYTDSKQRFWDSKQNSYPDYLSSGQLHFSLSPLLVKLLANTFWSNAVPQTTSFPFIVPSPWMQTISYEPNHFYPSKSQWQDLYLSGRDWPERYFDEDQGARWSFAPGSMNGFEDSLYFLGSRIFRREQPDPHDLGGSGGEMNESKNAKDNNETEANASSIRRKRYSMPSSQGWLEWVNSRCQEFMEHRKFWSDNVLDRICPYIWKHNLNFDLIGWWRNAFRYPANDNAFYYELIRNKRYNQNYWRNQEAFRDHAPKSASNWDTNNGGCKELNIRVNSEIPWQTWNMLRYPNGAQYAQGSREDSGRNLYMPESSVLENPRTNIFLCTRKDDQNNVFTFIRRDNYGDRDVPGQEKLWNNMDWNPNSYRDDVRASWLWRDKKETPDSEKQEVQKEVKRSTSDQGATTGRQKRWAMNWFPWSTYQGHDSVYDRPAYSSHEQGPNRWPQMYPFFRNSMYSDVLFPNKMNPLVRNLWYSLTPERYYRESGTGLNADRQDPNTFNARSSTWGESTPSNVKQSGIDGFGTGENVAEAEPSKRHKRWAKFNYASFEGNQAASEVENDGIRM